jgi:hypothetical protein
MILYNKTILLPNLQALYQLLQNNTNESLYTCKCIYEYRIAIKHYTRNELNIIQIWKTKSLFDYWFDPYGSKNFIAVLDYTIYDTYIKIVHVAINDSEHRNIYNNNNLDDDDADELIHNFVHFLKRLAIQEKKEKIILDVHSNLKLYLKYYHYIGFETTERKSIDNPFWIETELIVGG